MRQDLREGVAKPVKLAHKRGKKAAMEPALPVRSPAAAPDEAATLGGGTHASAAHMMGQ
jgi:hypothetical protein